MATQTETKTAAQWKREWRRLFKAEMKAAHALPEYIEGTRLVCEYEAAKKRGDLDAMDRLESAVDKARKAYIVASRRLPQHAEMTRITDMLRDFDTYGCAAGVRD
jgi:hypothetical protein